MKRRLIMLICFVVFLGSAAIGQQDSSYFKATNLFTEGITYLILNDTQVSIYKLNTFNYTGRIEDTEEFKMFVGEEYHSTNLIIIAEDNWVDSRKEYAIYLTDQELILGYLYETDVNSNHFVFEYAGYSDDMLQYILNY